MQKITADLELDFQQNNSGKCLYIQQGDASGGRVINVKLFNNGTAADLSGADNKAELDASVNGVITAAGMSLTIDHSTNIISIPITSALSSIPGEEKCIIRVNSGFGRVHSARFTLLVGEAAVSNDMPAVVETASIVDRVSDLEDDVEALEDTVSSIGTSSNKVASDIYWAIISSFPEFTIKRITLRPSTTPTLMGSDGYFDLDPSQYDNFNYEFDGVIMTKNQTLIQKPAYGYYPIVNGSVTIGEETYTSSLTSGVRVKFYGLNFDNTDTLYVQLLIKPYRIVQMTQAEYDALSSCDSRTLYVIRG